MKNELEDKIEDIEGELDDLESQISDLDDRIDSSEWKIIELEEKNIEIEKYKIYFFPATIKRYLNNLSITQTNSKQHYYPVSKNIYEQFYEDVKVFKREDQNFEMDMLKYSKDDNFSQISRIIANQGKSGFSFLEKVDEIIDINKPVLLFYGIEHLAAFFFNLHFNFTNKNSWEKVLKGRKRKILRNHGIGSGEFDQIDLVENENIVNSLLKKRIFLKKHGLCSRFLLTFYMPLLDYCKNQEKVSLEDLLKNFFLAKKSIGRRHSDFISIPNEIREKFRDQFGYEEPSIIFPSTLFVIYLLSFIFAHLSRYKMNAWIELLKAEEKNISFFINFIMKYGKEYFLKTIFERINQYEKKIVNFLRKRKNI